MTAEIIQLRDKLTEAQIRRVMAWAEAELAGPTRRCDHSLCQDLAHLMHQIDCAAVLAGATKPSAKNVGTRDDIDLIFLKLYKGAESLLFKAISEYPVTQELGKKPRRRRTKSDATRAA